MRFVSLPSLFFFRTFLSRACSSSPPRMPKHETGRSLDRRANVMLPVSENGKYRALEAGEEGEGREEFSPQYAVY